MQKRRQWLKTAVAGALVASGPGWAAQARPATTLLNASFDTTRELYDAFNAAFVRHWRAQSGQTIQIRQSHGSSGGQARSIIAGVPADVATLALGGDIDALHRNGRWVPANWQQRLPLNSAPYTSAILLLVRQGNPKGIRDWDDLVKPGVGVITPNPKSSGGARWNYLAAWEFARRRHASPARIQAFMAQLYRNVPVMSAAARGSAVNFAKRGQGDVLIAWESEAHLLKREMAGARFEIVYPSLSILTEPAVTVVDRNVERRGSQAVATAYLEHLYSAEGQDLAGRHFFRPTSAAALARHAATFPAMQLFRINEAFGGWSQAQQAHFADGASFDQIFAR